MLGRPDFAGRHGAGRLRTGSKGRGALNLHGSRGRRHRARRERHDVARRRVMPVTVLRRPYLAGLSGTGLLEAAAGGDTRGDVRLFFFLLAEDRGKDADGGDGGDHCDQQKDAFRYARAFVYAAVLEFLSATARACIISAGHRSPYSPPTTGGTKGSFRAMER